jgi:hypothetical protein
VHWEIQVKSESRVPVERTQSIQAKRVTRVLGENLDFPGNPVPLGSVV